MFCLFVALFSCTSWTVPQEMQAPGNADPVTAQVPVRRVHHQSRGDPDEDGATYPQHSRGTEEDTLGLLHIQRVERVLPLRGNLQRSFSGELTYNPQGLLSWLACLGEITH